MSKFIAIVFIFLLSSCLCVASLWAGQRLRMATTTSVDNCGLLKELLPPFEEKFKIKVDIIACGTGNALALGRNGDVDLVLVHAPEAEEKFVEEGWGINRQVIMSNDFVIVGPKQDPASIKGSNPLSALKQIALRKSPFISRGDESGTHQKERELWKMTGLTKKKATSKWYQESGQGMAATLLIADEKKAYCLSDRATFITLEDKIELVILVQADKKLFNPYSIISINPERHPYVNYLSERKASSMPENVIAKKITRRQWRNYKHALALTEWCISTSGQKIIAGLKKNGKVLFHPVSNPE